MTNEIAVYPSSSGADFGWRVSMARVDRNGSFSLFNGIDRSIAVLRGDGMVLSGARARPVRLTTTSAPFSFAGDVQVTAELGGSEVVDLNVMTERQHFAHHMVRLCAGRSVRMSHTASTMLVYSAAAGARVELESGPVQIDQGDTLLAVGAAHVSAPADGDVFVIAIWSRDSRPDQSS